jgi:glucosamine-6-phosphate deaminase
VILRKFPDKRSLAPPAADRAGTIIQNSIAERGKARIIAATGASLFELLEVLTKKPTTDWTEESSAC